MENMNKIVVIVTFCFFALAILFFTDSYDVWKNSVPEPIFGSIEHRRPFSFGPGTHYELILYSGVKGWENKYIPKWKTCNKLKGRYHELVNSEIDAQGVVEMFVVLGDTYFFVFVRENSKTSSIVRLHEWDDDYNFSDFSSEDILRKLCY